MQKIPIIDKVNVELRAGPAAKSQSRKVAVTAIRAARRNVLQESRAASNPAGCLLTTVDGRLSVPVTLSVEIGCTKP